jgi:serine/threonine protein kinase/tetratricopeptide (TPR) repeat protein
MIGETISHYRITAKLGEGGMGVVYRAEDTRLGREVALKFLPEDVADDEATLERFQREARAASALNHAAICTIFDIGEHQGRPYIVMELLEGSSLDQAIQSQPMQIDRAVDIGLQLADALDAAHERSIVHRDIKPSNIFVTDRGQPKILDFGLAKVAAPDLKSQGSAVPTQALQADLTRPGTAVGTVSFMSPEQARGEELDSRSDLFSLGLVVYEMVTGHRAFSGNTSALIFDALLHKAPVAPVRLNPEVPAALEEILNKALEKDRNLRYQHASDMRADLARLRRDTDQSRAAVFPAVEAPVAQPMQVEETPVGTPPPTPTASSTTISSASSDAQVAVDLAKRHKSKLLLALAVLLVIAVGVVFLLQRASPPAPPAEIEIRSLAVLPFANTTSDPETDYLGDGITESLINSLTAVSDLRVVSRTSAFRYKDQEIDPAQIGQDLDVGAVVTGRVTQRGDQLIVAAEMVDTQRDAQLWGERYTRPVSDIFEVQEEIARAIGDRLQIRLSGVVDEKLASRQTSDAEAYKLYLKGRFHWNKRSFDDMQKALGYYEQALEVDPTYALAWAGVADCYATGNGYYLQLDSREAAPKAIAAARKAIELDDSLAEAHTTLADQLLYWEWDWLGSEAEFQRAIELNPGYSTAHYWYSGVLADWGRHEESIREAEIALELDPLSSVPSLAMANALSRAGRLEEAESWYLELIESNPEWPTPRWSLAGVFQDKGLPDKAVEAWVELLNLIDRQEFAQELRAAFDTGGSEAMNRVWLAAPDDLISPFGRALVHARLGEMDDAFANLDQAFEEKDSAALSIDISPVWDLFRDDPRYADYVSRVNRPSVP